MGRTARRGLAPDAAGVREAVLILAAVMVVLALALHAARKQLRILELPLEQVVEIEPEANDLTDAASSSLSDRSEEARYDMVDRVTEHPGHSDQMKQVAHPTSSDLLASDEDRNRAAERIRAAVANGRLDLGELDARLAEVYSAKTHSELATAGRGLPDIGPRDALVVDRTPTSRFALGMFGGFGREGEWVVPQRFTAWSMWGGGRARPVRGALQQPGDRDPGRRAVGRHGDHHPGRHRGRGQGLRAVRSVGKRAARKIGKPGTPRVVIKGIAMFGAVVTKTKAVGSRRT